MNTSPLLVRGLCILALALTPLISLAQPVLVEPPPAAEPESTGLLPAGISPLQWGPVGVHPHMLYRFLYGTGINSSPGRQQNSALQEVAPGVLFQLGDKWVLDYTPRLDYYSSPGLSDTLNHFVTLSGGTSYQDWKFGLNQSYSLSSTPLVETAAQTESEIFATGLSANWQVDPGISVDLGVHQNIQNTTGFNSYKDWGTTDFVNFNVAPRLTLGVGGGFGYVAVSQGSDMTYEQALGRLIWRATDKLSLNIDGGGDFRQFVTGNVPSLINPIFTGSAEYHLFEPTTLSISASSIVLPSYFSNQVSENTTVQANLQQRLLAHFNLSLGGGYSTSDYIVTSTGLPQTRADNRTFFTARLSTTFLKRGSMGVFYYHSENTSSLAGYSYNTDQVGFDIGYRF